MITLDEFRNQFNNIEKIKVFEFKVIVAKTDECEYIDFNIDSADDKLVATHVALNSNELDSNEILFKSVEIDLDSSLDSNLERLYNVCLKSIMNSDIYIYYEDNYL